MDIQELILINSDKVRRDSNLMAFYIESFYSAFGFRPNCAGCTFQSDWKKFVSSVKNGGNYVTLSNKFKPMEKSFKLKKTQNKIFAYRVEKRTYRMYDNHFTEEFVTNFLKYGTKKEIEQRKQLFSILPNEPEVIEKPKQKRTPKPKQ